MGSLCDMNGAIYTAADAAWHVAYPADKIMRDLSFELPGLHHYTNDSLSHVGFGTSSANSNDECDAIGSDTVPLQIPAILPQPSSSLRGLGMYLRCHGPERC